MRECPLPTMRVQYSPVNDTRGRCTEWTQSAAPGSLVAHLPPQRVSFGSLLENIDIHHKLVVAH